MGTAPSPRTWVDEEIPPYSTLNQDVYDVLKFVMQPPMCKVRQTTSQNLTTATYTSLSFQTQDSDPYNWHSATTNPTRITPTFPGWYRGWYSIGFSTQTGGNYRLGQVRKNGVVSGERSRRDSKTNIAAQNKRLSGIPFFIDMNGSTDYLEVQAYQDCGATMATPTQANLQAELFLRYWGAL